MQIKGQLGFNSGFDVALSDGALYYEFSNIQTIFSKHVDSLWLLRLKSKVPHSILFCVPFRDGEVLMLFRNTFLHFLSFPFPP